MQDITESTNTLTGDEGTGRPATSEPTSASEEAGAATPGAHPAAAPAPSAETPDTPIPGAPIPDPEAAGGPAPGGTGPGSPVYGTLGSDWPPSGTPGARPAGQQPPPGYGWSGWPPSGPDPTSSGHGRWRFLRNAMVAWAVAGVLALTVTGLSVALATSSSRPTPVTPFGGRGGFFGGPGVFGGFPPGNTSGVLGTVASVGSGSFTVTAASGQTVTVDEQSSTTYQSGGSSTSAGAVTVGDRVAVSGARSDDTVKATRVVILPAGGVGPGGPLSSG